MANLFLVGLFYSKILEDECNGKHNIITYDNRKSTKSSEVSTILKKILT